MASRDELYQALRNADAAGDVEAATKLATYIQSLPPDQPISAPVVAKPSKERTFGEAAKDIAAGVVSGAGSLVQLPGQLYGLATGDLSDTGALGLGKDISKYGEEMKSAGLKAREAERAEKIKTAEKTGQWEAFKTAFGETIKDPALLTSFLAEQAPQLLVPFGAAKAAQIGTAAKAAAAAQGLVGEAATKAAGEITKAAAERGTRAAIGAGAVQQGADVGAQAYEDIYRELKSKGATDADAAQGAINLARAAGASGALISILAQRLPGARTLEESFAGVPGTGGRLLGAAKGALGEGLSEVVEETGGKFGANLAMREVKPEQSLLEGLGQTAGMAAVGGVGMGGVSGLARRPSVEKEAQAPAPVAEPEKPAPVAEGLKPETGETGIATPEAEVPVAAELVKPTRPTVPELRAQADREAQLQKEASESGLEFERRMAREQIAAGREMRAPEQEIKPDYVDLRPLKTPLAQRQAMTIAREESRQEGLDPERLELVPHPKIPDAMTLARKPEPVPVVEPAPTISPEEVSARIEQAGLTGKQVQRRAEDEPRQIILRRALQNIEERGGVASPEEARIVQEANIGKPYDRIDESLGRKLLKDELLTQATGIALSKAPRESISFASQTEQQRAAFELQLEEQARQQREQNRQQKQNAIRTIIENIQNRGGIASVDEAEFLQREKLGRPYNQVDPTLGETLGARKADEPAREISMQEIAYRLEKAKEEGDKTIRKAKDEARQIVLAKALDNIFKRDGVASPEEARVVQEANIGKPYDRVDDALGRTLSTDEKLTQATGIALAKRPREATTYPATTPFEYTPELQGEKKPEPVAEAVPTEEQATVQAYVDSFARPNTPAARAFKQAYDRGDITNTDIMQAVQSKMPVDEVAQRLQEAAKQAPGERITPAGIRYALRGEEKGVEAQLSDFEQTLRTTLNKFGLKDVGVKLIDGMTEEGSYAQQLIRIAADSANPIRTLRHEAIHALRELGFFTPQQWQSLSKMAKDKWIDQYLKQRNVDGKPLKAGEESRYDAYMREYEGDTEKITEEAVADAFADFDATKPPSGLMQALLNRLRNLFQSIKSALTKVESPEQIFGKVERGELKAKEGARLAEEARKSLRKPGEPAPTSAGQAALNTINQLGMGVKAPEKGRIDKVKTKLKQLGEAPVKDTAKEWRKAASDMFAKIDGSIFSADAPFENKLRQGFREDFKNTKDFVGALLSVSQSQAVAADAVSTRGMLIGKVEYREDLFKWVAVEDEANEINKARILDRISEKYGLTKEEAVQVAHTYLSAANYEGILKRNAANKERIKELRAEGNTDEANRLSAAIVYVSPEQATMVEPGLAIADQIPEVKEITALWNKQRENVKNTMVETGLWTPEYADAMMDNAAYVPFYREMEEEADANPEMMIRGLQVKAKEHKLKGSEAAVNDVFENMARWQQYAINRAIRNHKALQMIDAAEEMKLGDTTMARKVGEAERGKNVVRVWRDGKQEFYEMADPLFMDAFKSLGAVSIPTIKYFTKIANMLRESIVLYPMFSLGQVPQDAVAAIFASGLQPKFAFKIPALAVKEFIKTLRGTSNTHRELRDFGAVGVRDFNASVAREDAEITAGIKAPRGVMGKTKYVLERIAMSADNAVRQAVYEASMQQPGITKAEALEKAFEIINFRRRGSSKMVNLVGQTVPFFYAYLSAQRVAYKTITGVGISPTERKAALETLAYTSAAVMALSFIYAMANGDDEDYERTPSNVRDRSIVIPGTGGLRIPLRPDFFLFPKVIAEHTYHLMADNGFSDPAKFKKSLRDNFANAAFSPNVVPQIIKPTLEIGINYDFFQGKPIVGFFEQNKEASRQFSDSTSEFAKWMGGAGLSPQKVDHFVRGYFGTVGGLFLWGTNFFIEGEPGVPRPELSASDMVATMPGVGAFKQKSTENALKVDFYELRDAIEKAKNTYDDMKTRSPEGLQTFLEDEKNLAKLAMEKGVTKIADHLSKIRRAIQQTAAAPEDRMSASEKEERIKELREVEMQMLRGINLKSLREQAKL